VSSVNPLSPERQAKPDWDLNDPELYLNRELTWLAFNRRVLAEAESDDHPLLEQLKFLSIFDSNLDEFFMKRVGGLKQQVGAGVNTLTVDGGPSTGGRLLYTSCMPMRPSAAITTPGGASTTRTDSVEVAVPTGEPVSNVADESALVGVEDEGMEDAPAVAGLEAANDELLLLDRASGTVEESCWAPLSPSPVMRCSTAGGVGAAAEVEPPAMLR